jgi:hypothetical protein
VIRAKNLKVTDRETIHATDRAIGSVKTGVGDNYHPLARRL